MGVKPDRYANYSPKPFEFVLTIEKGKIYYYKFTDATNQNNQSGVFVPGVPGLFIAPSGTFFLKKMLEPDALPEIINTNFSQ